MTMRQILGISDHLPLILKSYQPKLYKRQQLSLITRAISEQKCETINLRLQDIDWNMELLDKSANEAYTCFHMKVQEILDTEVPVKTIKVKPKKILHEPWMSPGLLKSIKKQKRLYRKTINKNSTENDELKYKEYRNKLTQILRRTKEEYYKNKCSEFKRNTAKLWRMINKITQNMNDKSSAIEYLKIGNIDIYDTKLMSEEFAKHFLSVGGRYANKITNPTIPSHNI